LKITNGIVTSRLFGEEDQLAFAQASGDWNPLHMDRAEARRLSPGLPVVHGIHLLLWSLESVVLRSPDLPPIRALSAAFEQFVCVGDTASVLVRKLDRHGLVIDIEARGMRCAVFTIDLSSDRPPRSPEDVYFPTASSSSAPASLTFDEILDQKGLIAFTSPIQSVQALFPSLCRHWEAQMLRRWHVPRPW
jgi:acyl dehydratase